MTDARPMRGSGQRASDAAHIVNDIMEIVYNAHRESPVGGNIKGATLLLGDKQCWAIEQINHEDRMSPPNESTFHGYPVVRVMEESFIKFVVPARQYLKSLTYK